MVDLKDSVNIIYEDNHLLVVEKPINILMQEDETKDEDLLSILKRYLVAKYNKPGDAYLGLVHRLDRPVGGVVVFAKTSKGASRLSNQIRLNQIEKTYLAVVEGRLEQEKATLKDYLYKDKNTNTVTIVDPLHDEAKLAILKYEVLEFKQNLSISKNQISHRKIPSD